MEGNAFISELLLHNMPYRWRQQNSNMQGLAQVEIKELKLPFVYLVYLLSMGFWISLNYYRFRIRNDFIRRFIKIHAYEALAYLEWRSELLEYS